MSKLLSSSICEEKSLKPWTMDANDVKTSRT
jgi:hypothetical protein